MMLIPIAQILPPQKRRRALNPARIEALAQSIREVGLQHPITVGPLTDGVYPLIAGEHRLEAGKCLRWTEIPATIMEADEISRELWRIDENLQRAELTELERAEHLAERKRLYLAKHPETKPVTERGGPGRGKTTANLAAVLETPCFVEDTTAKTGLPGRSIRRAIHRAEAIAPEVREEIRDVPTIADSGAELDALAAAEPEEQASAVKAVRTGKAKTVREALTREQKRACPTKAELWWATMTETWRKGTPEAQQRFLEWVKECT